jgi:hypothetical protein
MGKGFNVFRRIQISIIAWTIYKMRGRVVSDIQNRAEGEKRLDENIRILQQFKINEWHLVRKLNLKFK